MDQRQEKENRSRAFFGKTPFVGIVILTVVIGGLVVDATKADGDNFYSDIIRLDNVATKIHQNYVEEMNSKDLIDNAIQGMLQILDPHTTYFESKQYEELKIHTEGKFGGLGIQISIRDKVLTVMTPIAGTPAERAGIQSGDQILRIDTKPTLGLTIDQAVEKLRGEPGTKVTISIRRKGEPKDIDYAITREIIHIKSVPYYGVINNDIGYVYLQQFSEDAGSETEKAVKELLKKNIKGLVFDLRHNPGGLLPQAIEVAEKFLPRKSLVVSTRGRVRGQNKEFYSAAQPVLPENMPLAVLVDAASASASEIVSGAIQDWDRGVVIGDTTFGKGSVQSILPLDKDHHLKLTTAFYYTPSGRCINRPENGVKGSTLDQEESESDSASADSASRSQNKSKIDTTTYKTKSGRIVHGSGGIIPDSVVQQKIPSMPVRELFGKDVFFQFANYEYPKIKRQKVKSDKDVIVDDATMKDFYHFLDSIKFKYQSFAQLRFEEFKKSSGLSDTVDTTLSKIEISEMPKWSSQEKSNIKGVMSRIDSVLALESKKDLSENGQEIKQYLNEALLVREYGQDNEIYYRAKLAEDPQIKAALGLLVDKINYSSLLKPREVKKSSGSTK
jgi:carboxyl-terminal processing protease